MVVGDSGVLINKKFTAGDVVRIKNKVSKVKLGSVEKWGVETKRIWPLKKISGRFMKLKGIPTPKG